MTKRKKAGPAPRGLDRFAMSVSGGSLTVDTGTIIQGPPVGTNTTGQGLNLRVGAHTAKNTGAHELQVAGIDLEAVMHLGSQFAGRRQYQYPWLFRAVAVFAVWMAAREQSLQDRQGEACSFTSTRLGGDHQVATLQHGGNGPLLHRSRLGIARCLDGAD